MKMFDGKVAFVTGAARGQGRSHAIRLAEEGANIIALDICAEVPSVAYDMPTEEDLDGTVKLVEDAGGKIAAFRGDVRDRATVQNAVATGIERFGRLDFVLANAGIMPVFGERAKPDNAWHDAIDIMLTGVFHTVECCADTLIEQGQGGSIVLTSSTAGLKGIPRTRAMSPAGMLGYHAAKHGVVGLMRVYANTLAPHSIRVNTVHPTGVNTPMVVNEAFVQWAAEDPLVGEIFQNALPIPLIEPVDISNAIVWLCSEQARYVTGVTLPVDAGFTMR
ncbi:MAG: mycofactocin-coupled SDR family oxidoreductase [Mycobacterium sp.]|uniref:mycofactocin-coupled SDR family oxidoreductase n=1 Tax=Mycobacterium sp. TaxID=1785 RepID=UPI003C49F780